MAFQIVTGRDGMFFVFRIQDGGLLKAKVTTVVPCKNFIQKQLFEPRAGDNIEVFLTIMLKG